MEELEAIDWYGQRMDVTKDDDLRRILEHNRNEEKEHAAMVLEWIRRRDPKLDEYLRLYLFTTGDVLAVEDAAEHGAVSPAITGEADPAVQGNETTPDIPVSPLTNLTVGSLRPARK
jgi:hypothetical protein